MLLWRFNRGGSRLSSELQSLTLTLASPLDPGLQGPGLRGWSSKEGRLTAQTKAMLAVFDHNTNNRLNLMKISFSRSVPV